MSKATRIGLLILIMIVSLSIDQVTKLWAYSALLPGQNVSLAGPIDLTLVFNRSNAFGFVPDYGLVTRWLLTGIAIVVATLITYRIWFHDDPPLVIVGLSFVAAGGIGNAIDRIWLGAVIDMFDASKTGFVWVFNSADVFIDVGIGLWLLSTALRPNVTAMTQAKSP
jgi:signal peptidase II